MWMLRKPTNSCLESFLIDRADTTFSYPHIGKTAHEIWPAGYDHDRHRVCLGTGEQAFSAACHALRQWRQFPAAWTNIYPDNAPLAVGTTVAMTAHVCRQWWINACRIVYTIDEANPNSQSAVRRFGFAYGTLQEHVESGEERFLVEQLADGSVWYDLRSFSRPRLWCARLAYPWVRRLQRRFVRDSSRSMQAAVQQS